MIPEGSEFYDSVRQTASETYILGPRRSSLDVETSLHQPGSYLQQRKCRSPAFCFPCKWESDARTGVLYFEKIIYHSRTYGVLSTFIGLPE